MPTHHVIIGGGPAATNAVETIRQLGNGSSEITLISDEPAHSRMALPYWLAQKIPRQHTMTADEAFYQRLNVQPRIGTRVVKVDPQAQSLSLADDSQLKFDNLLIATGASPLSLPIPGADLPGVQPFWTLAHVQSVLDRLDGQDCPRVLFVGAGFIGFIVLGAMFKRGWQLSVVEREAHVLPRMLDADAAAIVQSWLDSQGVLVRCGATVQSIREADDGAKVVQVADGKELTADLVVIATGIRPNLELIDGAGVETDEAILVNDRMQTNFPNIYAAGDVAQGPVLFDDRSAVHAIQPTAVDHGRVAGANMAGREVHYPGSMSMNVVDVCGLQCVSFGNWSDPAAEAMTISNPSGSVYRKLLWTGDQITGAVFSGQAGDLGMLNDVGMVKGIMQTGTGLGAWKQFLAENPFDIRRPYVATGVAAKLAATTLLGEPTRDRQFRFGGAKPKAKLGPAHAAYVDAGGA